jgi:heterodisulfide reductase subunit A
MKKKVGKALVVGAGISGIRSALDLAEAGYGVTLIDRSPHMGGILSQLDYQFPTDRCGMCKMLPLVDRDASSQYCLRKGLFHENIEILLSTELSSVEGEPGKFQVRLRQKPSWLDPDLCVGCGACVPVCPVEVPDAFNAALASRKAIYLPVPHAIPNPYVIDVTACTRCGACEKACPTGAIRLSAQERKNFRILVVDDELIIRDSLKAWLDDEEGFTVATAESGPDALDKLTKDTYQLMLLDIKMPGMDGVEVLKKAKEIIPELQVVMMTAYATVETAVEAMKIGALDYLIKPFETDTLMPKVIEIYEKIAASRGRQIEVGALVLCGGTSYFNPADGKNTFGYKNLPGVVTSLEFERIISGTGPCQGRLERPEDGRPVRKIAWIQCVGSRDLQTNADFCSNICCMIAIKEASIAREKFGEQVEATIFYMDMRTFGKSYQRYRDEAEKKHGVRFQRGRVHSVIMDGTTGQSGEDLAVRYAEAGGAIRDEHFDMVVLAVGQRPVPGTVELSQQLDIPLNPWGYCQTEPFSMTKTEKEGIVIGGAYSGLKDISESVIQASAAALSASRIIHTAGGGLALETPPPPEQADLTRELPRTLVAICTCGDTLSEFVRSQGLTVRLKSDPAVSAVEFIDQTCTATGWEMLTEFVKKHRPNRVLVGACLPYVYARKIKELAGETGLSSSLTDVVDIRTPAFAVLNQEKQADRKEIVARMESALLTGLARLKRVNPAPVATVKVQQQALVVGGGIAGMTAALAIADHGFHVDLIEKEVQPGGNLTWLHDTLEGHAVKPLLEETLSKVEKHPLIEVHTQTQVMGAYGQVGNFFSSIENKDGQADTVRHGVIILATGATEATPTTYHYGESDAIITQKELEQKLNRNEIDPLKLGSVVMIQCVESREEPRNYCSRVCCLSALKHALALKRKNPEIEIYIFYRDMMSYGFSETYFTQARQAGVIFIRYDPKQKPEVVPATQTSTAGSVVCVKGYDPILGRPVEIDADLVILSVGVAPNLKPDLAASLGASLDQDGFFQEAETKWRPVDSIKEGVFACGLAHSPRSITEAITTAEAAAQRALRILSHKFLPAGKIVASVHHSLCSLCERCIDACPYGARTLDSELEKILVNPVMCQGCGSCATVCLNSASVLEGFHEAQMFETIDAALEGTFG